MEALYIKLYEKYSKLKATKVVELDKVNQDQEVKFLEFVSAAESLIEHLTAENKRLSGNIDELRNEVRSLRAAKDQQFDEFQGRLVEESQKNQKLLAEIEQLRNMQHEGSFRGNIIDRQEDSVNNVKNLHESGDQFNGSPRRTRKRAGECSPHISENQFNESPTRMTRKRTRLSDATDSAINSPLISPHIKLSTSRGISADHPKSSYFNLHAPQPECCQTNIDNGGPFTCMFQNLIECLIGMKVSVVDQREGKCIHVIHQSSGYSFSLTWMNEAAQSDGDLLYSVSSLGTFAQVAPEWMREVIIFSLSMCPIFFERVSRIIKQL